MDRNKYSDCDQTLQLRELLDAKNQLIGNEYHNLVVFFKMKASICNIYDLCIMFMNDDFEFDRCFDRKAVYFSDIKSCIDVREHTQTPLIVPSFSAETLITITKGHH